MATRQVGLANIKQDAHPSRARLLSPLRYLQIKHPEKRKYDIFFPIIISIISIISYILLDSRPPLYGEGGIARSIKDILAISIPFLFGALASVAMGLPGPYFDRRPLGVPLTIDGRALTMRQFVAYLLGYVTFLSLSLLAVCVIGDVFHASIIKLISTVPHGRIIVFYIATLLIAVISSFLSISILWSLYFLTEVVNVSDDESNNTESESAISNKKYIIEENIKK